MPDADGRIIVAILAVPEVTASCLLLPGERVQSVGAEPLDAEE